MTHMYDESCPVCTQRLPLEPPRWIGDSEPCPVCCQPLIARRAIVLTRAETPAEALAVAA
jgi:hypothetical protein